MSDVRVGGFSQRRRLSSVPVLVVWLSLEGKEVTPREIRAEAGELANWKPGKELSDQAITGIAFACDVHPHQVLRALSRRDKRTPKSEGGPVTEGVTIRLNAAQKKKALKLAKKAGHKTVPAWVKALVEGELER